MLLDNVLFFVIFLINLLLTNFSLFYFFLFVDIIHVVMLGLFHSFGLCIKGFVKHSWVFTYFSLCLQSIALDVRHEVLCCGQWLKLNVCLTVGLTREFWVKTDWCLLLVDTYINIHFCSVFEDSKKCWIKNDFLCGLIHRHSYIETRLDKLFWLTILFSHQPHLKFISGYTSRYNLLFITEYIYLF